MVIETQNLTKYYGRKLGCTDVTLSVSGGQIFGLLGPNGAGKSTFIKMLVGLIFPTSGNAHVLGKPAGDIGARMKIGYLPEIFKYQEWMTGVDLLSFHASLYKMTKRKAQSRIEEVLNLVKLKGHEKYRLGTYSKGMQQRLGIASALLPDPDLLFLDEPTSALDPIGRREVREIMLELKHRGKTVLLNSHLLSEVEMVCDSAAIISKGVILKQGMMTDLLQSRLSLQVHAENLSNELITMLKKLDPQMSYDSNSVKMAIKDKDDIHTIASLIIQNNGRLYGLTPIKESLEDVFIGLVEGGRV